MEIKLKKYRNIFIILLDGELDLYNAPGLEKIFHNIEKRGMESLILDFSEVSYIDSSGVGILLKLRKLTEISKLDFLLCGIEGEVLNVLTLSNLIQFFKIANDYKSGVKKLLNKSKNEMEDLISD